MKNTVHKTNRENVVECLTYLWLFSSFYLQFITCIVQRKKRKKENFTYAKRNPQNEVISKLKSLMINDPQKFINSFFLSFSHEFWTFKAFLNLGTLSSLHINDLQEGWAHLPDILNRVKLKYIECAHMKWSHNLEQW